MTNIFCDFRVETERLLLRNYLPRDASALQIALSDEEVCRNVNVRPQTLEQVETAVTRMISRYGENSLEKIVRFTVAVVEKSANSVIGWAGLAPLELDDSQIEIYYGFQRGAWGKGYATEAAAAMLDFAFRNTQLDRICGITLKDNRASARVLEKIGLVYRCNICNLPEKFHYFENCTYYSLSRKAYLAAASNPSTTS